MSTKTYIDLTEAIQGAMLQKGNLEGDEDKDDKNEDDGKGVEYDDFMINQEYFDVEC